MSKRLRIVLLFLIFEILLASLYYFTIDDPGTGPNSIRERGEIIGQLMGVLLGVGMMMYFIAWKKNRDEAERKR